MSEPIWAYTNRLINEKSPYLLQHAHNPVDWYPWGEEAFNKAKKEYAGTAREIFEYVLRDMTDPLGGFYSAEDADSIDPEDSAKKKEGAFYLWTKEEIMALLGKEEGEIFCRQFGVESAGFCPGPVKGDCNIRR